MSRSRTRFTRTAGVAAAAAVLALVAPATAAQAAPVSSPTAGGRHVLGPRRQCRHPGHRLRHLAA